MRAHGVRFSEYLDKQAKQMKTSKSSALPEREIQPYQPNRVRKLLRDTRLELELFQGRPITFGELARYSGQAASTVFEKLHSFHHPQIEGLLCWLERLPDAARSRLLNEACRSFPSLAHPRLSHDPAQISRLNSLLQQCAGLTLISGANEGLRTFLITALGHTSRMRESGRGVTGLDRNLPDWFVPVEGVLYLNVLLKTQAARPNILRAWSELETIARPIVLVNGILSLAPTLSTRVWQLARQCNVFVADADRAFTPGITPSGLPCCRLIIRTNDRDQIEVVEESSPNEPRR